MKIRYSEEQQQAIDLACDPRNRIVGITGEAGTGKTTILKAIYDRIAENYDETVAIAAPTGRAAKRVTEATGVEAKTIHRLMRYSMPEDDDEAGLPAHGRNNPLPYKWVIIDEASMVNDELYRNVIDALPSGGNIRLIGDANQLPPVTGISPFLKVLDKFPSAVLTENFRSDDGLIAAARQVLLGRIPSPNDQFTILKPSHGDLFPVIDAIVDGSYRSLLKQIITPQNTGKFGTKRLNAYLQQKLNGQATRTFRHVFDDAKGNTISNQFRIGDKIIWTKNDYKLGLFNGMIGFVHDFDELGTLLLEIDNRVAEVPPLLSAYDPNTGRTVFEYDPRKNLSLAYAVTTHKAQGSEFVDVLVVVPRSFIMNRANFYTAITRAKDKCICLFGHGGLAGAMRVKSPAELKDGR